MFASTMLFRTKRYSRIGSINMCCMAIILSYFNKLQHEAPRTDTFCPRLRILAVGTAACSESAKHVSSMSV
jgi:hypothetical protein